MLRDKEGEQWQRSLMSRNIEGGEMAENDRLVKAQGVTMVIVRTKSCHATVVSHHQHTVHRRKTTKRGCFLQVALLQFSEFTGDECTVHTGMSLSKDNYGGGCRKQETAQR
jgi:hypothetical protein